ncbi:protein adenylyltransferase SelO [Acuticoccus yangtzensis]|uniref:protein adenylyltransferase SelO n=1 Tax=Acuticoccus yangtzensis TaxID=1443441 RepID=UPI0009497F0B|nr:YdiU family protein [Acuticoccus yangtzensis]
MVDAVTLSDDIFAFDNSYARLPERLFARVSPSPAPAPQLLALNRRLAEELKLDLDRLTSREGVEILTGGRIAEGSEPIAMAYAGHQFGNWVPQLGDGRALLLGEVIDRNGRRRDIQLKGSGRTPFSRSGDGKAAVGPVLREFIISEAMAALGIPTTRSLAAVATGERVYREEVLRGAVLTRVAASHVRVGTFQYVYARQDGEGLRALADFVIARHYPELTEAEVPALALFEAVKARQADLVARWMGVGFIHGVMNTDNMTISGETIDYGPCAFMDTYREGQVFSSIDVGGRYAYGNQPGIAHWNLVQLAQALLPLMPGPQEKAVETMQAAVDAFPEQLQAAWLGVIRRKLGLSPATGVKAAEEDAVLANDLLSRMEANGADFTLTFRGLAALTDPEAPEREAVPGFFADPDAFNAWAAKWRARLAEDPMVPAERRAVMNGANPLFIPRNHRVEEALAAAEDGDLGPFKTLCAVLERPFEDQPEHAELSQPPLSEDAAYRTFCGT